jgi:hypothetical protein
MSVEISMLRRVVELLAYRTSGISFAYRMDLRPVADKASRMVICLGLNVFDDQLVDTRGAAQ